MIAVGLPRLCDLGAIVQLQQGHGQSRGLVPSLFLLQELVVHAHLGRQL